MCDERKDFLEVTDEEIITDEEYGAEEFEDGVQFVTITTDDGREIEFVEIAELTVLGRLFTILQPTEELEDLDEDDVLIFEVIKDEDGNDIVELVDDDATIDAVSEAFYALSEGEEE